MSRIGLATGLALTSASTLRANLRGNLLPTILIVHRRDDSESAAGRLLDGLSTAMPDTIVLSNLEAFATRPDKSKALAKVLAQTSVMVVVIGRSWLTLRDTEERPRLDAPDDIIRTTIETALAAHLPVVPVLVQGSILPIASELPPAMTALAERHPIELRHVKWGDDFERLLERIETALADLSAARGIAPVDREHTGAARLLGFGLSITKRLDRLRRRFVPRSRHWRTLKRVAAVASAIGVAFAGYAIYRYTSSADLRSVERLSVRLTYETQVEVASFALRRMQEVAKRANDSAVIDAAVAKLKSLVLDRSKTSTDARRIRREAIEAVKSLRDNDLTRDFAAEELKQADLFGADLTSATLRLVSLENASLMGTKFVSADLSVANLSATYVRNADFTAANLSGADIGELDWFNAKGFTETQLQSAVLSTIEACPSDASSRHSVEAFRVRLTRDYRAQWDAFAERDRAQLSQLWNEYGTPGGLCEAVDRWLK